MSYKQNHREGDSSHLVHLLLLLGLFFIPSTKVMMLLFVCLFICLSVDMNRFFMKFCGSFI